MMSSLKKLALLLCVFCFYNVHAQVTLSTDFTDAANKNEPLHNIWSIANRISPQNGYNIRPGIKINIVRMIGGIKKKVNGENVKNLDFDTCLYDYINNVYVYRFERLTDRLDKIINSQTEIHQIVLDQPPWAFQHGYTFIPAGTRDNVNFREDGSKPKYDGASFAKILTGKEKRISRENLFWHLPGYMDERFSPSTLIQKRIENEYYKLFYFYETDEFEMYNITKDISEKRNILENPSSLEMEIALQMNADMLDWLKTNSAPTGTWIKNGQKVPYPKANDVQNYRQ